MHFVENIDYMILDFEELTSITSDVFTDNFIIYILSENKNE